MERTTGREQETVFSIFMGLAALLGLWDPRFEVPGVLWAFAAFLAFNLAAQAALRLPGRGRLRARVLTAGNTALVPWILSASGGADSYFWPMLLLPLFTAGLHLRPREARRWAVAAGAALAWTYRAPLEAGDWPRAVEFAVKAAGLALAAAVAGGASLRERLQRLRLERHRRRLARIAENAAAHPVEAPSGVGLDGFFHELGNPLTVILGSADLALAEAPGAAMSEDLQRIRAAARRCQRLIECLRAWSGPATRPAPGIEAGALIDEMLRLLQHQCLRRRVTVTRDLAPGLPSLGARSLPLQQAVLSLLHQVVERTADGGRIAVAASARGDGVGLRLAARGLRAPSGPNALGPCGEVLQRHGGRLQARAAADAWECEVFIPAEAAA